MIKLSKIDIGEFNRVSVLAALKAEQMSSNLLKEPFVSIVMNCHNSSKYLKEAIDSVYSQSYDCWEIIFGIMFTDDSVR